MMVTYLADIRKKSLALMCTTWYHDSVGLPEDRIQDAEHHFVDADQAERVTAGQLEVMQEGLEEILLEREVSDREQKQTLKRVITNLARNAAIECIIAADQTKTYITSAGSLMDIYLTDKAVVNKPCKKVFIRMLMLMFSTNLECVHELKKSLLGFASLVGGKGYSPRQCIWDWASRIVDVLQNLKRVPSISHPKLIKMFADLNIQQEYRYTMGNVGIGNQLVKWISKQLQRDALAEKKVNTNLVLFLTEQKVKLLEASRKMTESAVAEQPEVHDELEFDESSVEIDPGQGPSMEVRVLEETHIPANTTFVLTPVKEYKGTKRVDWTDKMKIELLSLYIR